MPAVLAPWEAPNLDEMRLDDFCGRVVTIVATCSKRDGTTIIRDVSSVRP
jgi:hypothetical protein